MAKGCQSTVSFAVSPINGDGSLSPIEVGRDSSDCDGGSGFKRGKLCVCDEEGEKETVSMAMVVEMLVQWRSGWFRHDLDVIWSNHRKRWGVLGDGDDGGGGVGGEGWRR